MCSVPGLTANSLTEIVSIPVPQLQTALHGPSANSLNEIIGSSVTDPS